MSENTVQVSEEESILLSIKKLLGSSGITVFDVDIKIQINTAFSALYQMGIGPRDNQGKTIAYEITDENNLWSEFITRPALNNVKTYIYLKVKSYFDPPQNQALISAIDRQLHELEVRMYTEEGGY